MAKVKIYEREDISAYNLNGIIQTMDGGMDFLTNEGQQVLNQLVLSVVNDMHYRMARNPRTGQLNGKPVKVKKSKNV